MEIKDQVLSIEQIKELQELGFDVEKYASMCWTKLFDRDNFYRILNKEYAEYAELNDYIPTLTIGDIMEILPLYIKDNENNTYWREINYNGIIYFRPEKVDWVFNTSYYKPDKPLIEALFETLKWCIINKHIAL